MKLRWTPRARGRQAYVDRWWRANRTKAPNLFDEELAAALGRIAAAPGIGVRYKTVDDVEVLRVLLPKTQQHIYYSVDRTAGEIVIHTLWGAARRYGPTL